MLHPPRRRGRPRGGRGDGAPPAQPAQVPPERPPPRRDEPVPDEDRIIMTRVEYEAAIQAAIQRQTTYGGSKPRTDPTRGL